MGTRGLESGTLMLSDWHIVDVRMTWGLVEASFLLSPDLGAGYHILSGGEPSSFLLTLFLCSWIPITAR